MKFSRSLALLAISSFVVPSIYAARENWPQWQGPDRTNVSQEKGLLDQWPEGGPVKVWEINGLGEGYGSVSVQDDRIVVQGTEGSQSIVFCLNRADGKLLWKTLLGPALPRQKGDGPRSTPTIEGAVVYALTDDGDLACLKMADGSKVWELNILKQFNAANPNWSISESPLIDGEKLIVSPGGKDASIVALDKKTGKTIWTSKGLSDPAAYSSCIVANVGEVRTIMNFTANGAVGVSAADGRPLWSYAAPANKTANCTTPVFHDNKVYFSSAYGTGGGLLKLIPQGKEIKTEEVYFNKTIQNHHGGVVFLDGYLYGFSDQVLTCMEFETGKEMWKNRSVGKGSLTLADGKLFIQSERNLVALAEASPKGYVEKGRFPIVDQGKESWAHPVVCGGRLFIRNQGILACYDVKGDSTKNVSSLPRR